MQDYQTLKTLFDTVLNTDKSTYKSSNDESTPIGCIEEMLSKIPEDFWKKNVKILDPCCGNGNFNLVALSKGATRNNLFFNDVNDSRLANVLKLFGNVNVSKQDFFDMTGSFDLIHFNPPYAKIMPDGKRAAKNHTLVRDFVTHAFKLLKPEGYMVFIIPDNWMSLADRNKVAREITSNQLIWLDIHGAKKWFPKVGSSFTWAVLQKKPGTDPFTVECAFKGKKYVSNVESQTRDFIPLLYTKEVQSILKKTIEADNVKFNIETTSDLHKYTKRHLISSVQDAAHPYRLIHTPKQTVWASRPHKYQDGYKVFISTTDKYQTFIDTCGMTQSIAFVRCHSEEEAKQVKQVLDGKLYVFMNNICRWGNFNNIRILQKFPVPSDFGFTKTELDLIDGST